MKHLKFWLITLLLIFGSGLLALAQDQLGTAGDLEPTAEEIAAATSALGDEGFIGIIACTFSTDYHFTVADSARAYAESLGLNVQMVDSEINVDKQIQAIENFANSGAQVIVICLFDPPSVLSALEEAADKGVKIVQYAGRQTADLGGVTISIEDADLGRTAGEYAAQLINDELGGVANVAILDFPDVPNVVVRADAIREALETGAPEATIVGNYKGGTTEFGLASMESALVEHPEINVVVSINDAGAYGALQALENAGRSDALIVGIDAEPQALELIAAGGMYRGTVDTAPAETGVMTINAAVKLLAGSDFPHNIAVPVNLVSADTGAELGTAGDLEPTEDELAAATSALGEEGFIGFIACTFSTDYHFTVADRARAHAESLGLNVQMVDSEINVDKQIQAIENFANSGAQVIVICLFDPPSVLSALEEAANKGVKIVQYAGRQTADLGGVTISIEDADLGRTAGEYAAQLINDELGGVANVAILDFPDVPNVVVRADAIRAALENGAPEATIVGNYKGGTTEFGLASMESALVEHPEINVVVSINDAGAYGALQALENAGRSDALIVGIDAEPQALELIAAGGMYRGTVDTAPAETGVMTINAAVKLLAGSDFPHNIAVPVKLVSK
jgi:ribose transport system substrate-binding protein